MRFHHTILIVLFVLAGNLPRSGVSAQAPNVNADCSGECAIFMPFVNANYHVDWVIWDDFSVPSSGWPTVNDDFVAYGYQDDAYEMTIKQAGGVAGVFRTHKWSFDYRVTVSARITSGSYFVYGLIFYTSDADDEIHFFLDNMGRFSIQRFRGGHYQVLVDWQSHAAVRASGESNVLTAEMLGDTYAVLINGVEVARGEYVRTGEKPGIGLILFSAEDFKAPATVQFDDLTLRRIRM